MWSTRARWSFTFVAFVLFFVAFFSVVLFGNKYLTAGDGRVIALPSYLTARGLWEPNVMLGYPWVSNFTAFWYPLWLLRFVPASFNSYMLLPYILAAFGTFGLVFRATRSWLGGIVAGLSYSLGGFMISHLGHYDVVHPATWTPFVLWSMMELRRKISAAWIVAGSLSIGMCATAGQPQVLAYTLFVALAYVCTMAYRCAERRAYVIASAIALVLGIGVSAVALLPAAELVTVSTRAQQSFGDFITYAISPVEIPVRLMFPWFLGVTISPVYPFSGINPSNFTEVSNYAGITALIFAIVALLAANADIEVRFWMVVACVGLVLSTGDYLGIGQITYHVPLFNLFRAQGRNALEVTLALAVLAGYGVAAIDLKRVTRRHIVVAVLTVAGSIVISLAVIAVADSAFAHSIEAMYGLKTFPIDPLHNPALGIPVGIFALGASVVFAWSARPDSVVLRTAIVAVVVIDMSSFAWFSYWRFIAVDRAALKAPPYAATLRRGLDQKDQRFLTIAAPSWLEADLPLLWALRDAGGFVQLPVARTNEFMQMDWNGAVAPEVFSPGEQALDLAAVRYVVSSAPPATIPIAQLWYGDDLRLRLGTQPWGARSDIRVAFPTPIETTGVALQETVEGELGNGVPIARLFARTVDGRTLSFAVAKGFRGTVLFERPERLSALGIHWIYAQRDKAMLSISHLSLLDAARGVAYPVTATSFLESDPSHWQPIPGMSPDLVFENRHLAARAWLVHDVRMASDDEKYLRTSDVDLRAVAFVEGAASWRSPAPSHEAESADVREVMPARMLVDVRCVTRCFLVTSDAYYEGWSATIDDAPTPVFRADYALRGIALPQGRHRVRFSYLPWTILVGGGISLLSLLALAGIALSTKIVQGGLGRPGNRPGP